MIAQSCCLFLLVTGLKVPEPDPIPGLHHGQRPLLHVALGVLLQRKSAGKSKQHSTPCLPPFPPHTLLICRSIVMPLYFGAVNLHDALLT